MRGQSFVLKIIHVKLVVCCVQDVRPEEEFSVSHIPGAVRVEPGTQPDIQAIGITPNTTGKRDVT